MKLSRVAVLGIAAAAGLIAMVLAFNLTAPTPTPPAEPVKTVNTNTEKVLVATKDVSMGATLTGADMAWRDWPKDSISASSSPAARRNPKRPSSAPSPAPDSMPASRSATQS